MFKPLLRTIPNLSGNVQLSCKLDNYTNIDNNNVECLVRYAKLLPLNSNLYHKSIDVSLLNSCYDYDLPNFYKWYNEYFYDTTFTFNKIDYTKIDRSTVQNNRDSDFEFGVKRTTYSDSNSQFIFFAPIYIENTNDIPDYFLINVSLQNDMYYTERTIKVNINCNTNKNYLYNYINHYAEKLDSNVIYLSPYNNQAVYYGINVINGGFCKCSDNIIAKIYNKQTTINGFDSIISNGFKRNKIVIKQILPLSFNFNIDDILSDTDKTKYKYAKVTISGKYYMNNKPVDFYDFNIDYTELNVKYLQINELSGIFNYVSTSNNIMNTGFPALNDGMYYKYNYSNKLIHNYNRWKLNYSSDDNPYITNINYAFSINQGSTYKYHEYPSLYSSIKALTDTSNNIIIPLGNAVTKDISPYYLNKSLAKKYKNILNNYSVSWFNTIDTNTDIQDIFNNDKYWVNVTNNKAFHKGILYDFNNIYYAYPELYSIDKFSVFVRVNFNPISLENIKNIKKSTYTIFTGNYKNNYSLNCTLADNVFSALYEGTFDNLSNLYCTNNANNDCVMVSNKIFLEDTDGEGDFISLTDYGLDIYDINKYFKRSDIINTLNSYIGFNIVSTNNKFSCTNIVDLVGEKELYNDNYFSDGYELLPIYKLNEIYINNANNNSSVVNILDNDAIKTNYLLDKLYYSESPNTYKLKYDKSNIDKLYTLYGDDENKVSLYNKQKFISYSAFKELFSQAIPNELNYKGDNDEILIKEELVNKYMNSYISYLTGFEYYPELTNDSNELYAKDCFVKYDSCIGRYYGDFIPRDKISEDKDLLYVDPYNINNIIKLYNASPKNAKLPLYSDNKDYDYDLQGLFDFMEINLPTETMNALLTELVGTEKKDEIIDKKLQYPLGECSDTTAGYNYLAKLSSEQIVLNIYNRKGWIPEEDRPSNLTEYYKNVSGKDNEYKTYKYTFVEEYGDGLADTSANATVSNYDYETLNDNNSYEFYARFLNKKHFYWYIKKLYNDFDLNKSFTYALETLYVKKRMIITVNDENNSDVNIRDVYTPLIDFYDTHLQITEENHINLLNKLNNPNLSDVEFTLAIKNVGKIYPNCYTEYFYYKDKSYNITNINKWYKNTKEGYVKLTLNEIKELIKQEPIASNLTGEELHFALLNRLNIDIYEYNSIDNTFKYIKIDDFKHCIEEQIKWVKYIGEDENNNMLFEPLTYDDKINIIKNNAEIITYIDNNGNYIPKRYKDFKYYETITSNNVRYNEMCNVVLQEIMSTVELCNNSDIIWQFTPKYSSSVDIDSIAKIYKFNNNTTESKLKFELCYKKRFIKLNNNLFNLINLDNISGNVYRDLYVYRIYKKKEYPESLQYYWTNVNGILNESEEISRCLVPLFNEIFIENQSESAIYNEYIQNSITPCTYAIWKNNSNSIFIAATKEDVENITGQTAIQHWCPYHVHYFWYSGSGSSIDSPSTYAQYYRYNADNSKLMLDISYLTTYLKSNNMPLEIKGKNKITGKDAIYCTSTYINDCNIRGIQLDNTYVLSTYTLLDNCYANMALYEHRNTYEYDSIAYTYVDTRIDKTVSKNIYTYYDKVKFDLLFDENNLPEYDITDDGKYCVKTTYNYISHPTYTYTEKLTGYTSWYCNDYNLFDNFNLNTYNVATTYTYTYTYTQETKTLVKSYDNSFASYYVNSIENKIGIGEAVSYTTYGFYILDMNFDNSVNSFNIVDSNYNYKKYFSYVNGNYIYKDNYSILDTFELILPFSKINTLDVFKKNISTMVKPHKFNIKSNYISSYANNLYTINYIENSMGNIVSQRYLDDIVPYLSKTVVINNAYYLKYKDVDTTLNKTDLTIYKTNSSIYNAEPYKIYDSVSSYTLEYPVEYKFYNDNKYYNLESEFTIKVKEELTYKELLLHETQSVVLKYFTEHININNKNSLNNNQILFLFNKYNVKYYSVVTNVNLDKTEKLYTLEYKFTLL